MQVRGSWFSEFSTESSGNSFLNPVVSGTGWDGQSPKATCDEGNGFSLTSKTLLTTGNSKMRKVIVSALAVAFATTLANAQATFFFDDRGNGNAIDTPAAPYTNNPLGGVRGDAQTTYVAPLVPGAPLPPSGIPANTAQTHLYVDYAGAAGEVLAAVGLDYSIAAPAAGQAGLAASGLTIYNTAAEVDQTGNGLLGNPWNDTAGSGDTTGGTIKAVRVPVSDGGGSPAFDATLGITAGTTYRLATVDLTAEDCSVAGCDANLDVFLSVNNLLVTQVSAGGSGPVSLNFGFDGAGAVDAADNNGDVEGATSSLADAIIVTRQKGDFNGDGNFNGLDFAAVIPTANAANVGNASPAEVFTGDFNGDGNFNGLDFALIIPTANAANIGCVACIP